MKTKHIGIISSLGMAGAVGIDYLMKQSKWKKEAAPIIKEVLDLAKPRKGDGLRGVMESFALASKYADSENPHLRRMAVKVREMAKDLPNFILREYAETIESVISAYEKTIEESFDSGDLNLESLSRQLVRVSKYLNNLDLKSGISDAISSDDKDDCQCPGCQMRRAAKAGDREKMKSILEQITDMGEDISKPPFGAWPKDSKGKFIPIVLNKPDFDITDGKEDMKETMTKAFIKKALSVVFISQENIPEFSFRETDDGYEVVPTLSKPDLHVVKPEPEETFVNLVGNNGNFSSERLWNDNSKREAVLQKTEEVVRGLDIEEDVKEVNINLEKKESTDEE